MLGIENWLISGTTFPLIFALVSGIGLSTGISWYQVLICIGKVVVSGTRWYWILFSYRELHGIRYQFLIRYLIFTRYLVYWLVSHIGYC